MRDATQREEQFRQRVQPTTPKDTPLPPTNASSASTESFHTPAIEPSPHVLPALESTLTALSTPSPTQPVAVLPMAGRPTVRHTATEETLQAEYRSTVKLVPSSVLKSTIQNYMIDHHPSDENLDGDEEDLLG